MKFIKVFELFYIRWIKINQTIINNLTNSSFNETAIIFFSSVPFSFHPALDIFLITIFASLFTTLINKYMTDQVKIKALRSEMKLFK